MTVQHISSALLQAQRRGTQRRDKNLMSIEVRRDPPTKRFPEGDVDEICGTGTFHVERMNDSQIALILYAADGETMSVMFEPKIWPKRGHAKHVAARVVWHEKAR